MFRGFFQSRLFAITALGVVVVLALALLKMQPQRVVVEKKIKNFQDKINELEKSNSELARLLDYFKSDAYLEREAKLKLNVKRPDEEVVFLNENDTNPAITIAAQSETKVWKIDHWFGWIPWFIKLFK